MGTVPLRVLQRREWLTPAEVAVLLGVCRDTVYSLVQRGELAHVRVGSTIRIRSDSVRG